MLIGALEGGGTKMVCAVGKESGEVLDRISIPTTTPEETVPKMLEYFKKQDIEALGIGTFGPIEVHKESTQYGSVLNTPKLAWKGFNFVKTFQKELQIPIGFDTDVNASCLGEIAYGQAQGLDTVMYLTVGTGIGAGIAVNGQLLHGMLHPEAGHVLVRPLSDDPGKCVCPYHTACLEGMASGPSIEKRWGRKAFAIGKDEKAWEIEADYLAQALCGYILTLSPQMIILGGGVMHQEQLFPIIRDKVTKYLAGYIDTPQLQNMQQYIVPPSLQDDQGIKGCFKLALNSLNE